MICRVEIGSAWIRKDTKDCVVVVAANRTGHQYDRFWLLEVMRSDGSIGRIEDYSLLSNYCRFENQEVKDD